MEAPVKVAQQRFWIGSMRPLPATRLRRATRHLVFRSFRGTTLATTGLAEAVTETSPPGTSNVGPRDNAQCQEIIEIGKG